ncbi:MAG: hypothetical protein RIC55_32480 [Pirellulaceae bacterium]
MISRCHPVLQFCGCLVAWVALAALVGGVIADDEAEPAKTDDNAKQEPAKSLKGIEISKETTVIDGPRRDDGRIDYLAALNQRLSKGVTPENNAAVPLLKALPRDVIAESLRARFYEKLGVEPSGGGRYLSSERYLEQAGKTEADGGAALAEAFESQLGSAMKEPWAPMERPELGAWIAANERPLDAIAAGMSLPHYYMPLVGDESADYALAAVVLPSIQSVRDVARALTARAMLRLRLGKVEQAASDLLACHQLARHVGEGYTLIEGLVAIAIDGVACQADVALAASGQLSARQALDYAARLAALPRLTDMVGKIDVGERYMFLDAVMTIAVAEPGGGATLVEELVGDADSPLGAAMRKLLGSSIIDWNVTLREGNRWYDRLVEVGRTTPYDKKLEAMEAFDEQLKKFARDAGDPVSMLSRLVLGGEAPGKALGRQMSNTLVALLLPAVQTAVIAELRGEQNFDLARLTLILAAYRADNDAYPESLSDLAPRYVKQTPRDRFRDEPLVYRRTSDGFLLYSVGPNRVDDDGGQSVESGAFGPADLVVGGRTPGG